jgi:hypothetical protein
MHIGVTTMQRNLGVSRSTWVMKELNPMDMKKEKRKEYTLWKPSIIYKNMYKVIKKIMRGLVNEMNNKMISASICYRSWKK